MNDARRLVPSHADLEDLTHALRIVAWHLVLNVSCCRRSVVGDLIRPASDSAEGG
jgi:hypothetical protein